ncbi:MAG: hypothetical protein P9L98_03095 [Candidatus Kaelpia imicola]|nr:hypothetical protein [Candidatus Kaelpia imicola]
MKKLVLFGLVVGLLGITPLFAAVIEEGPACLSTGNIVPFKTGSLVEYMRSKLEPVSLERIEEIKTALKVKKQLEPYKMDIGVEPIRGLLSHYISYRDSLNSEDTLPMNTFNIIMAKLFLGLPLNPDDLGRYIMDLGFKPRDEQIVGGLELTE